MTDASQLADLTAKLAAARQRILRDRDHARQIDDVKVREEVEAYIKELERSAEDLAAQIAVMKAADIATVPEIAQDTAAFKPPAEPDTDV